MNNINKNYMPTKPQHPFFLFKEDVLEQIQKENPNDSLSKNN